jgi:hypothetical protein
MTSTDSHALEEFRKLVFKQELLKSRLGQTLKRMDAAFPGLIKEVPCPKVDGQESSGEPTAQNSPDQFTTEPTPSRFQVP